MFEKDQNKDLLDEISRLKNENLFLKEKIKSETNLPEITLLEKAFYSSKNLIALIDVNLRFLAANDSYINYYEKNRDEIIGNKLENVVGSNSFKKVKEKIDKCLLGQTIEFEDWFEEKKIGRKYVKVVYTPFFENDKVNGVLISEADITQRKQTELDLKESEAIYKTLVKSLNEGLWQIDSEGKTVFTNTILEKMFGYSKNEMKGKLFFDFMEKEKQEKAEELFEKRKQGVSEKHNFDFLKKDGSTITVYMSASALFDENNNFIGALASVKDITAIDLAQKSLKESEERYKSLFYSNKSIMLLIDPDTKKIVDANNSALDFYGYTKNEILKLKISDINILKPEEIAKLMQNSIKEKQNVFEFKHKLSNGKIKDVNVYSGNIIFGDKSLLYSIIIDISEKKKVENNLKESEARYKTLVSNLPLVTFVINKKGLFTLSEGKGLSKLGLKPGQVVGLSVYEVYKDYSHITLAVKKALQGVSVKEQIEIQGVIFDVLYSPLIDEKGNVTKVIGVANDITESKKIERELRESESKFRLLVENQADGVIITDKSNDFIFANPAAEEIFGLTKNEIIGKNILSFISDEHAEQIISQVDDKLRNNFELQILKNNGKKINLLITSTPFDDNIAGIHGKLSIFRDITEIKKQESKLKELLVTKNKFFNIIAHDLRNPFNALLGFSELLYLHFDSYSQDKIQMMTKAMYDTSKTAFKLVENLLTWSRSQSGKLKFEPNIYSLNTIINNPIHGGELMAKNKNINIEKKITENVNVFVDKNLIYTTLRNLVSNAIKFTKPNGKIIINTEVLDEFVQVSVSDTGVGIEKSRIGNLFKIDAATSTQGTENEAGTGLGLILCKEFIEKLGGEIWVASELNQGSTFYFTIPLAEKKSQ